MAFVEVYIVGPDRERFRAEIDEDADEDSLLQDLVTALDLPATEKGRPVNYSLRLVDALRVRKGVTIEIVRAEPASSVRKIVKE